MAASALDSLAPFPEMSRGGNSGSYQNVARLTFTCERDT